MNVGEVFNKETFLSKVASSLGRERRTSPIDRPSWKHNPQYKVFEGLTQEELVNVFVQQCTRIHTDVETTTVTELNKTLSMVMNKYEVKSIVSWDDPRFREYEVDHYYEEATASGIDVHIWNSGEGEENIKIAERADVGITFSDMTLAESATVVLLSGNGKGRSVSLLPKYYVAIIPKSTIVPRMTQAATKIHQLEQDKGDVPSCVNFISGPSNSADIEMNLVVGVHGPIKVTYIIVMDK
ncbi:LutC/YkgG family protein [Evansella halocellulosilytica]|uniref:LutC/YkgG family protein n=1 Tax=Evansella halocellulosilytica TaxID=2011013 RepID=UPI000BB6EA07|nr:lactate utilization protein C [Evansella halocellulosilytica]